MAATLTMNYRIALSTLGCKVNQADSDRLAASFEAAGCAIVDADQPADAYVVNTCTVTLVADRKARKLVRGLARRNPAAVVAVTGCYVEGTGRALFEAMPEVDVVKGHTDQSLLPEAVLLELRKRNAMGLLREADSAPAGRRVRAMLKVQDGCSHVCGFCIVPSVRGPMVSRRLDDVLDEVREKVDAGVAEFVLCGIRLGAYGWDWSDRRGSRFRPLQQLATAIAALPGVQRLRLSSILPLDIGPDLFAVLADLPPVCEHLHLPLQSGDDGVLKAMGRGYTVARFRHLVDQAREQLGDLCLATDVLAGYPGESEAAFEHTLATCEAVGFGDLHVFGYSPRPGTRAADLPDLDPIIKQERVDRLLALRDELRAAFATRRLGTASEVLVEQHLPDGSVEGLTRDYLRVRCPGPAALGDLLPVRLDAIDGEMLLATPAVSAARRRPAADAAR